MKKYLILLIVMIFVFSGCNVQKTGQAGETWKTVECDMSEELKDLIEIRLNGLFVEPADAPWYGEAHPDDPNMERLYCGPPKGFGVCTKSDEYCGNDCKCHKRVIEEGQPGGPYGETIKNVWDHGETRCGKEYDYEEHVWEEGEDGFEWKIIFNSVCMDEGRCPPEEPCNIQKCECDEYTIPLPEHNPAYPGPRPGETPDTVIACEFLNDDGEVDQGLSAEYAEAAAEVAYYKENPEVMEEYGVSLEEPIQKMVLLCANYGRCEGELYCNGFCECVEEEPTVEEQMGDVGFGEARTGKACGDWDSLVDEENNPVCNPKNADCGTDEICSNQCNCMKKPGTAKEGEACGFKKREFVREFTDDGQENVNKLVCYPDDSDCEPALYCDKSACACKSRETTTETVDSGTTDETTPNCEAGCKSPGTCPPPYVEVTSKNMYCSDGLVCCD